MARPAALSAVVRDLLDDPAADLSISAVSAWEVATKIRIGRSEEARPVYDGYVDHLRRLRVHDLAVTTEQALLAGSLEWEHRDPFDRMIGAQAISEQLVLVTADRAFRGVPGLATLW